MSDEGTQRRRGPYAKTPARREAILQTAVEVFGQQGFRGSSLREIAERVGLSESGVLHHFGGKVALLQAVLQARDEASLRSGMALRLEDLVAHNASRPGEVRLFVNLSAEATDSDHPAHEYFVDRYAQIRARQSARLRAAADAGHLADGVDPDVAARLLLAAMDGLQIQWLLDPDQDMAAAFRLLVDLLHRTASSAPSSGDGE